MSNNSTPSTIIRVENKAYLLNIAGCEESGELTVRLYLPLTIIPGKCSVVSQLCDFINKRHQTIGKFGVDAKRRINYTEVISRDDDTLDTERVENAVTRATSLFVYYYDELSTAAVTRYPYDVIMKAIEEKERTVEEDVPDYLPNTIEPTKRAIKPKALKAVEALRDKSQKKLFDAIIKLAAKGSPYSLGTTVVEKLARIILEITELHEKLESPDDQSFYFKKGIESNQTKLESLKEKFEYLRSLVSDYSPSVKRSIQKEINSYKEREDRVRSSGMVLTPLNGGYYVQSLGQKRKRLQQILDLNNDLGYIESLDWYIQHTPEVLASQNTESNRITI